MAKKVSVAVVLGMLLLVVVGKSSGDSCCTSAIPVLEVRQVTVTARKVDRFEQNRLVLQITDAPGLTMNVGLIPRDGQTSINDERIVAGTRILYRVNDRFSVIGEATIPGSSSVNKSGGRGAFFYGQFKF